MYSEMIFFNDESLSVMDIIRQYCTNKKEYTYTIKSIYKDDEQTVGRYLITTKKA